MRAPKLSVGSMNSALALKAGWEGCDEERVAATLLRRSQHGEGR